jgi:DNA-directed RNA polymerase specialized sigma24 family protein
VQLRFFSGMTVEEVAQELSVTERSVYKDWRTGRAFLRRRMSAGGDE